MTDPETVLGFWFGQPARDENELMDKVGRWFRGGPAFDREVTERFGASVEAAIAGALDAWAKTPRGRMALVILLDQLTRNVLRDDPRMYAGDANAQQLALQAFDQGVDRELTFPERMFLSMPLLHAEDLRLHERLADISEVLCREAPPPYQKVIGMHAEQVAKYRAIIERFGRFPHRNDILGRETTAAERAFLADWAEKGPPTGAPPPRS